MVSLRELVKFIKKTSIPFLILLCGMLSAEPPKYTATDLDNSLKYYYKVSKKQNLSVNDRLAILHRIKAKYKDSALDFTQLDKEIALLEGVKKTSHTKKESAHATAQRKPSYPSLKRFFVEESADSYTINLHCDKPDSYNSFLLKDPDPAAPPKIILDLYGIIDDLPKEQKEFVFKSQTVDKVKVGLFEKEPNPIVRVVVFLKKNAPYKVNAIDQGFSITVKKDASEIKSVVEPTVAVSTAPVVDPNRTVGVPSKKYEYRIEPGDVLGINIYPADELSRETPVSPDGNISLPLIGVVAAKGETPENLSEILKKRYAKFISKPDVVVIVKQYAKRHVFITGEIKTTGAFPYKENFRLMELISQAGGFTEKANRREIKVYRGEGPSKKTFLIDIEDIIKSGDFTKDFQLAPGDIVEVPPGARKISVLGDVKNPGNYDYRENIKLIEALSLAGGFSDSAKISQITILRKEGGVTKTLKVNADDILKGKTDDIPLNPEDTVYLPKKTLSSATWWVQNVMPWLSLISLILIIRAGI